MNFNTTEAKPEKPYSHHPIRIEKKVFSIPLKKIIGVRVDTAKNVSLSKVLAVGIWAFGWKDKILAIDFKDDTGMQNTVFFTGRNLEGIRDLITAKRYELRKNPKLQKKAEALSRWQKEHCVNCGAKIESGYLCHTCKEKLDRF